MGLGTKHRVPGRASFHGWKKALRVVGCPGLPACAQALPALFCPGGLNHPDQALVLRAHDFAGYPRDQCIRHEQFQCDDFREKQQPHPVTANLTDELEQGVVGSVPRAEGRQRPLGITALEGKLVQRATVEVLNASYETDFLGFSYGFRPGRGQHKALDALYRGLHERRVNRCWTWTCAAFSTGWLTFTPFAGVIPATLAPGSRVSFRIFSFCSTRRNTRRVRYGKAVRSMGPVVGC